MIVLLADPGSCPLQNVIIGLRSGGTTAVLLDNSTPSSLRFVCKYCWLIGSAVVDASSATTVVADIAKGFILYGRLSVGNQLDTRRVDAVDVDKGLLLRETNKHKLDCSCN